MRDCMPDIVAPDLGGRKVPVTRPHVTFGGCSPGTRRIPWRGHTAGQDVPHIVITEFMDPLTPHIAGLTHQSNQRATTTVAEAVLAELGY